MGLRPGFDLDDIGGLPQQIEEVGLVRADLRRPHEFGGRQIDEARETLPKA